MKNPLHDLFHGPATPGVLGVFGHLDAAVGAVKHFKTGGRDDLTVFSPMPGSAAIRPSASAARKSLRSRTWRLS